MAKTSSGSSGNASRASEARTRANEAIHEIKLAGNQLVDKVRELIEEGNVRRIVIKKEERVLFELPLTIGVGAGAAAVLVSPVLAALGAVAALVTDVTLVVERDDEAEDGGEGATPEKTVGRKPAAGDGG